MELMDAEINKLNELKSFLTEKDVNNEESIVKIETIMNEIGEMELKRKKMIEENLSEIVKNDTVSKKEEELINKVQEVENIINSLEDMENVEDEKQLKKDEEQLEEDEFTAKNEFEEFILNRFSKRN